MDEMPKRSTCCTICNRPFTPEDPKIKGHNRHGGCDRRFTKEYCRHYYADHNQDRLGKPRGRAAGSMGIAHAVSDDVAAIRLTEFHDRMSRERAEGPRSLPRRCEFCTYFAYECDMARQFCELNCTPCVSGACDWYEPRYRVEEEEENEFSIILRGS
jgi:hypothetical protein